MRHHACSLRWRSRGRPRGIESCPPPRYLTPLGYWLGRIWFQTSCTLSSVNPQLSLHRTRHTLHGTDKQPLHPCGREGRSVGAPLSHSSLCGRVNVLASLALQLQPRRHPNTHSSAVCLVRSHVKQTQRSGAAGAWDENHPSWIAARRFAAFLWWQQPQSSAPWVTGEFISRCGQSRR